MEAIRACREAAGLSQKKLARRLGVSQQAICQMELPGKYPDPRNLPKLADALGCSIDALFGRDAPVLKEDGQWMLGGNFISGAGSRGPDDNSFAQKGEVHNGA